MATRFGTFDDLLRQLDADTEPNVIATMHALRNLVFDSLPEAVEVVRLGDGAATYGVGPKKMSEAHVYIMPRASYVNLGFFHGSELADPEGLLEGTGKRMRHVKVRSDEEARRPALGALIDAALAERREALGLT